jgi:hypothetical protein
MLLRAVLGLVIKDKRTKINDGKEQSKLASFYWKGANEHEKDKFRKLCSEFKKLHQQLFPDFKFRLITCIRLNLKTLKIIFLFKIYHFSQTYKIKLHFVNIPFLKIYFNFLQVVNK